MFSRDRRRRTTSSPNSAGIDPVEQTRRRASLRLLFDPPTADRIAARDANTFRSATRHWTFASWRRRVLRNSVERAAEPPLAPTTTMPAQGAVALAVHLGMGTTVDTLAGSSDIGAELLGIELYRTRASLTAGLAPACGPFMSSLGRYRDLSLDIGERATVLQHAQRCDACRSGDRHPESWLSRSLGADIAAMDRQTPSKGTMRRR